ncbi:MAG: serine/threonine-protein kinase, partial [bacterium]
MSVPNIPGYSFVEKIREGATATSWKAIQTSLRRPVVIKILATEGTPDDQSKVEGILSQMRKVASLKHSAFFELIDIGEHDGMYYVVMGGSDGQALSALLSDHKCFREKDILGIATDAAEALHFAWTTKRLYHGNIKPDNIVVHPDGNVVIADMGMARVDVHFDQATGQTHEMIVGTPNYMSPEQVQGRGGLDCRTDIYSLGATLYQLATGTIPFGDSPGGETMNRHLIDLLPDPRDINPDISPALAGIIAKMMVKSPGKRYQSWDDVVTDLKKAASNPNSLPRMDETALSTVRLTTTKPSAQRAAQPILIAKAAPPQPLQVKRKQAQPVKKQSALVANLKTVLWLVIMGVWVG